MKLPVDKYTDEEIQKRLDFAAKLESASGKRLPAHLQAEKDELVAEQERRAKKEPPKPEGYRAMNLED
jgi:hypothetical protein